MLYISSKISYRKISMNEVNYAWEKKNRGLKMFHFWRYSLLFESALFLPNNNSFWTVCWYSTEIATYAENTRILIIWSSHAIISVDTVLNLAWHWFNKFCNIVLEYCRPFNTYERYNLSSFWQISRKCGNWWRPVMFHMFSSINQEEIILI